MRNYVKFGVCAGIIAAGVTLINTKLTDRLVDTIVDKLNKQPQRENVEGFLNVVDVSTPKEGQ